MCLWDTLGLPGASQGPTQADFRRQPKIDEKMAGFCEAARTSRELPGDRKINEKTLVCEQKALQTWILCRYLCTKPFSMIFAWFWIKFSRKIAEHLMESLMYFFTSSLDFLNMVTLTKHRILRYESYFFIFWICVFISKISSKSWDNTSKTNFCFKKPSIMAPGVPFWLPKRSQIHVGETWNPKNALKKWFSDHAISWTFFKTPKILNYPPK